ncbi:Uncharacterized protein HZ326_27168 [Fusarium oxysporum f. sp. albedinis]|nr:Uncharacterized protein HZ326_27168 [Fusarium oxysporum f. sp. albedinis]
MSWAFSRNHFWVEALSQVVKYTKQSCPSIGNKTCSRKEEVSGGLFVQCSNHLSNSLQGIQVYLSSSVTGTSHMVPQIHDMNLNDFLM